MSNGEQNLNSENTATNACDILDQKLIESSGYYVSMYNNLIILLT